MQILNSTPASTIFPLSGVDISIHKFVGVSWHILMPYTIAGIGLMIYCQVRLVHGQRQLRQVKAKRRKTSLYASLKSRLTLPKMILEFVK